MNAATISVADAHRQTKRTSIDASIRARGSISRRPARPGEPAVVHGSIAIEPDP